MIKDIEIKNFRCFQNLKVTGFEKVNLISGRNNIGKTTLLEALFLNSVPRPSTVFLLRLVRKEESSFSRALPERTWNNFFFQQDKSDEILIEVKLENGNSKTVKICVDESVQDFLEDKYQQEDDDIENRYINLISESETIVSVMQITTSINHGEAFKTSIISNINGLISLDIKVPDIKTAFFIPSFLRITSRNLTKEMDKARLNEREDQVLKAFKIIDPLITSIDSFSIGEPTIYLKRDGEVRLPLSLFGDAINRIANIILTLINNENSILFIDEIENGIHHSSQKYFWSLLYNLSCSLNVQIFATTHSLEMTQAFIEAGLENDNLGAHFELAKHSKTGKIVAIRRDLQTLDYGIRHHKEVRGE